MRAEEFYFVIDGEEIDVGRTALLDAFAQSDLDMAGYRILNCPSIEQGVIQSVGLGMPSQFVVQNSPLTQSGVLGVVWAPVGNNYFLGNTGGPNGQPTFQQIPISALSGVLPPSVGGVPAGGAAGQVLRKNTAADYDCGWSPSGGTNFKQAQAGQGTTTSTTGVMIGFGAVGMVITPKGSGTIFVIMAGSWSHNLAGGFNQMILRYGTGTPPPTLSPPAGTAVGEVCTCTSSAPNAVQTVTCIAIVQGLVQGTPYWFDAEIAISAGSGATGTIYSPLMIAMEM